MHLSITADRCSASRLAVPASVSYTHLDVYKRQVPEPGAGFKRFRRDHGRKGRTGKKLIKGGDSDANLAYYCLHKFQMRPSEFLGLDPFEKAFLIAAIQVYAEEEKKAGGD